MLIPVAITVEQATTGGWSTITDSLRGRAVGSLMVHTVLVALTTTALCAVLGVASAWVIERTTIPGRRLWTMFLVAPLTIPLFVTSFAWSTLGSATRGFAGAVAITALSYYPIVFLLCAASLRTMDPALEECALSMGCSRRRTFWRVVLPQLGPALLGGLLLVALDTLVEFDAFVGIHFSVLSTDIYAQYESSFSTSGAAVLSCFSIVLCLAALGGESIARRGAGYTRVGSGTRRPPVRYTLGRAALPTWAGMGLLVGASVGIPVGTLVYWFTQASPAAMRTARAGIHQLLPATGTSVWLGVVAAVVGLTLALPIALAVTRHPSRTTVVIERASYMSFALPDLVAAIALSYGVTHWIPSLNGNIGVLVFAYSILFVPLGVVALRATFGQIEPRIEESARSLGLGAFRTLWRVTLPLSRPGLAAAGVLVFAFILSDLSTTQVLLPPGMSTLGTQFWADSSTVAFAAAAPYAAVLIALSMVAAYVLMSRFGRVRASGGA